jgi:hypothetical protein
MALGVPLVFLTALGRPTPVDAQRVTEIELDLLLFLFVFVLVFALRRLGADLLRNCACELAEISGSVRRRAFADRLRPRDPRALLHQRPDFAVRGEEGQLDAARLRTENPTLAPLPALPVPKDLVSGEDRDIYRRIVDPTRDD